MANAATPTGIATSRSRNGCVTKSPRLRRGVPVSQLKTNGTRVSGTSRTIRSRRIHDQLLATVVRRTAGAAVTLVGMVDDVLDRFALGQNRPDQVLDHGLVIRMVGVGEQPFLVGKVRDQRKIGIAVLDAEIAAISVGLDGRDLAGQLMKGRLDLGNVLGGGLRLPAEKGDVAQHWRFRAYPIAPTAIRQRGPAGEGGASRPSGPPP